MTTAADRDVRAGKITHALLDAATKMKSLPKDEYSSDLDAVVSSKTRGFREILLVVVVGRLLDPAYKSSSLYECNPRALYEGPIRAELDKHRIPRGKSGPLNIAKAAKALDSNWAAQRRPRAIALKVVTLAKAIDSMNPAQLTAFGAALAARLLNEASRVDALAVDLHPAEDPVFLANMTTELINQVPDSGNTPQRIIGLLLDCRERATGSAAKVLGLNDRASVTSTTANKLGDLALELPDGTLASPMEVTVKPFGESRVLEAAESAHQYAEASGSDVFEILVVCRPEDVHDDADPNASSVLMGSYEQDGIIFYFINIYEWILSQLMEMSPSTRRAFHTRLDEYVGNPSTAEAVKQAWLELNS